MLQFTLLLLLVNSLDSTAGVSDDVYVEQYQSPFVVAVDPGTHMTQNFQNDLSPYSSSTRREFHEEQRYVNGQPVYERRHERQFEDGRLVHQDGYETGSRDENQIIGGIGGYEGRARYGEGASGNGGVSRTSSSRSSYQQSSSSSASGNTGANYPVNSYTSETNIGRSSGAISGGSYPTNYNDRLSSVLGALGPSLHEGNPNIRLSLPSPSSHHEEKHEESRFIDGQQIYSRTEERRYQDGQLIHNVSREHGSDQLGLNLGENRQNNVGTSSTVSTISPSNTLTGIQTVGRGTYNPGSDTSYRTSYYRPGVSRVISNSRRTSQSSATRPTNLSRGSSISGSESVRTQYRGTSGTASTTGAQTARPVYRTSYTPSSSIERVPQNYNVVYRPASALPSSSINSQGQTTYSNTYQTGSAHNRRRPGTYRTDSTQVNNEGMSYSRVPASATPQHGPGYSYQPSSHISQQEVYDQARYQTNYGSGSYIRPTEATSTQTTSRITDTHPEPYSDRSSSYQPIRTSSLSAWSDWNGNSTHPRHRNYNRRIDSQSSYESSRTTNNRLGITNQSEENEDSQETTQYRPTGYLYNENDYNENYGEGRATSTSSQSTTSTLYSRQEDRDASIRASPGQTMDLSLTLDVGEGDSIRLNQGSSSVLTDSERYDINPYVDGGVTGEANTDVGSSSVTHHQVSGSSRTPVSNSRSSSFSAGSSRTSSTTAGQQYPVSEGSTFGATRVTNRTTNTVTSHIRPIISSYRVETRTSRRYLNGMLVSEIRYSRYYENGQLVHENATERSRDQMQTEGVDVAGLDLSVDDMIRYGLTEIGSAPMSHSQRFEMSQEREYVDGAQVYESTHERRFQDGKLIHEQHDEMDKDQLLEAGRDIDSVSDLGQIIAENENSDNSYNLMQQQSSGSLTSQASHNSVRVPIVSIPSTSSGSQTQYSEVGSNVRVSVSPITTSRKTEVRREQEYRDGEQVYDLHHERQYEDGQLIHENRAELGPEDLGTAGPRDALLDILAGRTLGTASESNYQHGHGSTGNLNSYRYSQTAESANSGGSIYDSTPAYSSGSDSYDASAYNYGSSGLSSTSERGASQQSMIGNSLLSSNSLTSVIGTGGVSGFDLLSNVDTLSRTDESTRYRGGGGAYYAASVDDISSGHGTEAYSTGESGLAYNAASQTDENNSRYSQTDYYGQTGSQSGQQRETSQSYHSGNSNENQRNSQSSSTNQLVNSGSGQRFQMTGNFGAYGGYQPGVTESHHREMEVEERYENGHLVSGREQDTEWRNNQLLRHDVRRYGEGEGDNERDTTSTITGPTITSSSSYQTTGGDSSVYGASASFGAHTSGTGSSYGSGTNYGSNTGYGSGGYESRSSYESQQTQGSSGTGVYESGSSGYGAGTRSYGSGAGYSSESGYSSGSLGHSALSGSISGHELGIGGAGRTHRREMEVEEHYENGQLVKGREEDREWTDNQLIRHDRRNYGQGAGSSSSSSAAAATTGLFQDSTTGSCASRPCQNGANCRDISGSGFFCICTLGFRGATCRQAYCPSHYCRHNGVCEVTDGGVHQCSCPVNYTGPRCERRTRGRGVH